MPVVPRVAADPLRVVVVPVVRTAEEAEREVVPGAAERATLVRPVEERRETPLPVPEAVLPPARVSALPRPVAPHRETKLRVLRDASR